ncbi:unnamed protein product, partial [Hapterophycus canaliculatus]
VTTTPSADEEVYLCLLRVYLHSRREAGNPAPKIPSSPATGKAPDEGDAVSGGGGEGGGLEEAVSLLKRYFSRVDPVKAMALLPPEVPVSKVMPFLSSAVRHAEARRRDNQV